MNKDKEDNNKNMNEAERKELEEIDREFKALNDYIIKNSVSYFHLYFQLGAILPFLV